MDALWGLWFSSLPAVPDPLPRAVLSVVRPPSLGVAACSGRVGPPAPLGPRPPHPEADAAAGPADRDCPDPADGDQRREGRAGGGKGEYAQRDLDEADQEQQPPVGE